MVTYAKISPRMVNPRDIIGNTEELPGVADVMLQSKHCQLGFQFKETGSVLPFHTSLCEWSFLSFCRKQN